MWQRRRPCGLHGSHVHGCSPCSGSRGRDCRTGALTWVSAGASEHNEQNLHRGNKACVSVDPAVPLTVHHVHERLGLLRGARRAAKGATTRDPDHMHKPHQRDCSTSCLHGCLAHMSNAASDEVTDVARQNIGVPWGAQHAADTEGEHVDVRLPLKRGHDAVRDNSILATGFLCGRHRAEPEDQREDRRLQQGHHAIVNLPHGQVHASATETNVFLAEGCGQVAAAVHLDPGISNCHTPSKLLSDVCPMSSVCMESG